MDLTGLEKDIESLKQKLLEVTMRDMDPMNRTNEAKQNMRDIRALLKERIITYNLLRWKKDE